MPPTDTGKQNVIALVYDFDGTLCPQPMQEYTVLPQLGIEAGAFWEEVNREASRRGAEKMLVYMRLLIEHIESKKIPITRENFTEMGSNIEYFQGVESWFDRLTSRVKDISDGTMALRHYVISAGLKEILEGTSIYGKFHNVFASEYHYSHFGAPIFPKILITDTHKTQFLFRINKGREDTRQGINEHMPEAKRPIPFSNIIYVGDGDTDVPSMAVVKQNGGHALAVYNAAKTEGIDTCLKLLSARRIDFFEQADFRAGKGLDRLVGLILEYVVAKIRFKMRAHLNEAPSNSFTAPD